MAYILNKTNGVIVATVQDAALDNSTSLTFIGRNYAGYGEIQNENFVKLLENFANTTTPANPLEGQLWFDTLNRNVNIYDGTSWKPLAVSNVTTDSSQPSNPKLGDLWYDAVAQQLYAYNGSSFALIGPASGADLLANWKGSYEYSLEAADNVPIYNAKAVIGADEEVIAVVSNQTYTIQTSPGSESYPMAGQTTKIYKGITLAGADSITGSSSAAGVYFWGTAAEALNSQSTSGLVANSTATNQRFNVAFLNTQSGVAYINTGLQFNPGNQTLYAQNLVLSGTSQNGSAVGVGQTWQSFTPNSQRAVETFYTNSTGKPIVVSVDVYRYNDTMTFYAGTTTLTTIILATVSGIDGGSGQISAIIPDGSCYKLSGAASKTGGDGIRHWAELR
jgi:hypothetical protein